MVPAIEYWYYIYFLFFSKAKLNNLKFIIGLRDFQFSY